MIAIVDGPSADTTAEKVAEIAPLFRSRDDAVIVADPVANAAICARSNKVRYELFDLVTDATEGADDDHVTFATGSHMLPAASLKVALTRIDVPITIFMCLL